MLRLLLAQSGSCRRVRSQREVCCRQSCITANCWPTSWRALWRTTNDVLPAPRMIMKIKAYQLITLL